MVALSSRPPGWRSLALRMPGGRSFAAWSSTSLLIMPARVFSSKSWDKLRVRIYRNKAPECSRDTSYNLGEINKSKLETERETHTHRRERERQREKKDRERQINESDFLKSLSGRFEPTTPAWP